MTVAFIDTETTGLNPDLHWPWEIAVILPDGPHEGEHCWQVLLWPDQFADADPVALDINGFRDRYDETNALTVPDSAERLATLLDDGRHLVAANPGFDVSMLSKLYPHSEVPWPYHTIDISSMAIGWLHAAKDGYTEWDYHRAEIAAMPPYKSSRLGELLCVKPTPEADRHKALSDARWVRRMYEAVTA